MTSKTPEAERDRRINDQRKIEDAWRQKAKMKYGDKLYDLLERAWAAGFFDGEGSVFAKQGQGVSCSIEQTITGEKKPWPEASPDSIRGLLNLERFQRVVGVAKITARKHRKRGNEQPTYEWRCTSQKDIQKVWNRIGEFLSLQKRDEFAAALAIPSLTAAWRDKAPPAGALIVETDD